MTDAVKSAHDTTIVVAKRSKLRRLADNKTLWRGFAAITLFILFWEVCSQSKVWFGVEVPFIGKIPPPSAVLDIWAEVVQRPGYWQSWYLSFMRVFLGFTIAMIVGIPFGMALAVNRYFRDIFFPPFEILRPIPPLAWVPASIIFWPTTELPIAFVTFLGAFFTIVINVLGGARTIDVQYLRAAQSMGATPIPGTPPFGPGLDR